MTNPRGQCRQYQAEIGLLLGSQPNSQCSEAGDDDNDDSRDKVAEPESCVHTV